MPVLAPTKSLRYNRAVHQLMDQSESCRMDAQIGVEWPLGHGVENALSRLVKGFNGLSYALRSVPQGFRSKSDIRLFNVMVGTHK